MKIYIVNCLIKEAEVQIDAYPRPIIKKLALSWSDDMVGCMPVFSSKEAAEEYSNEKFSITEADVGENNG